MKDLYVLAADADMQAVFRAILRRPDELGISAIDSFVERHVGRDSGVFGNGPELVRAIPKSIYRHFILAFDHHGSGCNKHPDDCARAVQDRLDTYTFKGRSTVIVIAPELDEWLLQDGSGSTIPDPKERLRQVFVSRLKRGPRPQDFEEIAANASLQAWNSSLSFRILKETLQNWFPRT